MLLLVPVLGSTLLIYITLSHAHLTFLLLFLLFPAIYNMSVLVVSAFSLAGTVTVIRVHHKRGHVPDWLEAWILRLPCHPPGLPLRKHIIESLVLSNHSLNRSSTVSTICDGDGRTSPTPIIPRIRLKWPDVAKTLDRVLLVMLVGINAILIGYFLGIWMAYFVLHESTWASYILDMRVYEWYEFVIGICT